MYWVLDIGGTALKHKIFDSKYKVVYANVINYGKLIDGKEITKIVTNLFHQLKKKYTIKKIAISSLGIINSVTGQISGLGGIKNYNSVNWKNIFEKYHIPVFIENDGNCAALYEISLNPKINNAIILVVGTGLGGAAIINRKLYKGSHDGAGEVGIGLSEIKNKKFINISNVSSMYAATNGYYQLTGKKVSGQKLFSLYPRDKHVKQLIDSMIYHLAKTLINLALFIDPEYVFIGGGVSKDKRFMSLLKMQVDYLMKMSQLPKMFKVLPCHDCNDANINGALTLIK